MSSPAAMDIVQEKRFLVRSSSLKDIRSFAREVFDKLSLNHEIKDCLLYTSPSPRDATLSRMPSSA